MRSSQGVSNIYTGFITNRLFRKSNNQFVSKIGPIKIRKTNIIFLLPFSSISSKKLIMSGCEIAQRNRSVNMTTPYLFGNDQESKIFKNKLIKI